MSDKTVLLPCPFCCSDAEYDTIPAGALVKCSCCGVELRNGSVGIGWYESSELAAADWNRRAALAQQPAPVAVPSDFALRSRVADLLHLLQFAKIETPSHGDAVQAEIAMNDLERMLAAPTAPVAVGQAIDEDAAYQMGAKGADPTEAERLLFEAWMRGHCWKVVGEWDGRTYIATIERGGLVDTAAMLTRQLWAAWRDRAALTGHAATPAAEQPEMISCACGDAYPASSFGAGFIASAGHCENCDAAEQSDTVAELRDLMRRYFGALDRFDQEGPVSITVAAAKEAEALEKELRALLAGGEA